MASTNDLKNGLVLNLEGQLWSVVEFQHVKPGKGPAFVRTKLKHVLTGKVVDKTFNAGIKVDTATVDRREMTYLYQDGNQFVFMDGNTYEQIHIDGDVVGDSARFLLENQTAVVATHEGVAAVHRAADVGRAGDHSRPTRACRATAPPVAPSRPRWRPVRRSRSRCSCRPARRSRSTPATAATSAASAPRWARAARHASARSTSCTRPPCGTPTR